MKRTALASVVAVLALAAPVAAQHGGGSAKPPKPAPAAKVQAPKPVKTQSAPKSTTAGPKVQTVKATGAPKTTKPVTAASSTRPTKTSGAKTTSTSGTSVPPPTTTLTPVQLKLQRNTNLASKLQSRLPTGTNLQLAAGGFRNLGQFVAAVNVSNNLGIPFAELKTRMVGQGMSLGQAIQDARPKTTNTTTVVTRAERDADDLIRETDTEATKTTKVTKTTKPVRTTSGGGK